MWAITVEAGKPGSARVEDRDEPCGTGSVLVEAVALGVCGTDREIVEGKYGSPPPGQGRLVLGHESLGRVVDPGGTSDLSEGDLVVGIVRRPDPVPCRACAGGEWDMCTNGLYTERGIKELDGFGCARWWVEPEFALGVDPGLGLSGVLVEPASVVAKAWDHVQRIGGRAPWQPQRALVTGAGPVGLLAALLGVQMGLEVHVLDRVTTGPKPKLVADLGATYHVGSVGECPKPDVAIECTGAPQVVLDVAQHTSASGVVCLTGVSSGGRSLGVDAGELNRQLVLENDVIFGSVNANRHHYETAVDALAAADRTWLARLITRREPLSRWEAALELKPDDVKVVIASAPAENTP